MQPYAIFYEAHNLGGRNAIIQTSLSSLGYTATPLGGDAVAELKG